MRRSSLKSIIWVVNEKWSEAFIKLNNTGLIDVKVALVNNINKKNIHDYWKENSELYIDSDILQKGVFPEVSECKIYFSELNHADIEVYAKDLLVTEVMMDRIDPFPENPSINSFEKRYYNKKMFSFWEYIIKKYEIDCVFINESPHGWHSYSLYSVSKRRNIKHFSISRTIVPELFCISDNIGFVRDLDKKRIIATNDKEAILYEFERYIEKARASYSDAVPKYMVSQKEKSNTSKIDIFKGIIKNFTEKKSKYFSKTIDRKFGIGSNVNRYMHKEFIERKLIKRIINEILTEYKQHISPVDLSSKYIYFPLHYQPERTSNPEGGFFEDQLMVLNLLDCILPKEYYIYVKEHKSQYYYFMAGNRGRWKKLYSIANNSNRIKFVDVEFDPFNLIDNCTALATITGTSGFEALCRNKRVLLFGKSWYRSFNGVFNCFDEFDVDSMVSFLSDNSVNIDVKSDITRLIYLSKNINIDKLDPVDEIFKTIEYYINNIYSDKK